MLMAAVSPTIASGDISGYRGYVQWFGSELGNAAETWCESELRLQRNYWKRKLKFWGGSEQYESNHCTVAQQVEHLPQMSIHTYPNSHEGKVP